VSGLFALLSVCAAPALGAGVARIEFSVGEVRVVGPDGSARAVRERGAIYEGDMVVTGRNARVGLRFSDGGRFRLQPNSRLRVDQYRFDWQTRSASRSYVSLVTGALRAITGAIGHYAPDRFRLVTRVATIGVRGTEYTLRATDRVVASVNEGEIQLCNGGGCSSALSGETYYVPARDIEAIRVAAQPPANALDLPGDLPARLRAGPN
jgi:hypothetical protein